MKMYDAATALAFIENARKYVEREVNETIFPEILYPSLIPVDTSAPEWTKTIEYRSQESYGKADWINGNADDIPLAGNSYGKDQSTVFMAGIGYGYGYEELHASMAYGVNLPNADAIAARQAYEQFVDKVAFLGDASKGKTGLLNADGVAIDAATATFATANESQILQMFNKLIGGTATGTAYRFVSDTVLLPFDQFTYLASTPLTNKEGTLLDFVQKYNIYSATTGKPLVIRAFDRLNGAGAGGVDRAVAYSRNPTVVKLHIPMPHRFLPVYQTGALNFVVPGVFRLSGTEIRNKAAVRYMDGV